MLELSPSYKLNIGEVASLLEISTRVVIEKDSSIVTQEGFNDNIYLISNGIFRSYMINEGEDMTVWFYLPGEMMVNLWCYKHSNRSPIGIMAATDAEVFMISKSVFKKWSIESIENAVSACKLFEGYVSIYEQALLEYFQCGNGKDRYLMIMQRYPELLQQIPLNQLASYLWITPQSLSRIRRNI